MSDVTAYFDYAPWKEQYVVLVFGVGLAAVFLGFPARRGGHGGGLPLADKTLTLLSLVIGIYSAVRWPAYAMGHFDMPVDLGFAVATIAIVLEATRRTAGDVLLALAVASLVLGLTASLIPAPLSGREVGWQELAVYLYTDSAGIVGLPLSVASTVLLAFILFGTVLFISDGGQVFIDLALVMVGRYRGGPAKAAVVASSLFGSISGSAVSNAVTTGALTTPLMMRTGYTANVAAGVEAVASTGGQLLPPVMGASCWRSAAPSWYGPASTSAWPRFRRDRPDRRADAQLTSANLVVAGATCQGRNPARSGIGLRIGAKGGAKAKWRGGSRENRR